MLLRSVSRLFVCLILPLQVMALNSSPWSDCWNVAMTESFSPSNYNNFSNLPHIANNGFSRAEYGSSGALSDACALAPGMNNVQYFGLKVTLEAGYNYRLKWTGKTSGFAKPVQVHFGASPVNTQVIGNSHLIPLLNPSLPAPAFTSQSFTPPANGQYFVLLKLAPGSIGSGSIRFDDLVLERSCSLIDPPNVFFTTHEAEASEGGSVEICVGIQTPYIYHTTQVNVAALGAVQPHLASFSTQTLTFPAGSTQNQCFTFQIPANNEPDGDFTYLLKLQNPSSTGGQPQLIQPDTLMLRIKDDVLLNDCYTWSPGVTHTLDNELPGSWQHDAQGSLSSDWADYSGDYAYKTDYSEWNYIAIPFQLSPMFSYRLKWKGRAQNSDGAAIPEILLMRGAAPNSGVQMPVTQQAAGSWGLYTGEAFEVAASGTYYLTIKGGSTYYNLKTKLHIDDIVLERVCKTTSVAFSSVTPLLVQGDEGALFRVCLDIANPSPHRATSVVLNFTNGTSPHFAGAPSPIVVTFPAGSSERQCVDIPSTLWPGDDPRSQYSLQIQSVTGGVYPAIGPDVQRSLQMRDANTCWNTAQQQNFSTALQNLGNISGWISNNGATRSGYGATGQMFDYCASMTMSSGHYAGFQQWLETGKQYRVKWNLKVDSNITKSIFLSVDTQAGDGNKVGIPVSIAPSGNAQPGVEFISEYFSVPSNGSYYLLLRSGDGESAVVKFDDFRLEARCPVTEVAFQQSLVETAEGNALLVCVQISNPSPNSPTTVEVSFEGSRSPHFNGVPATRTVTFPAGSSTPQCLLFPSAANGQYDGGFTEYTVRLQNVTGSGARIAQPDRAFLRITDDVSLNDCQWAGPDRQICTGQSTQLGLPGTAMPAHCSAAPFCFRWEPAALILNDGQYDARPFVAPQQDTWFVIYMTDGFGNLYSDSVLVQVAPALQASITGHEQPVCSGGARTLQVLTSSGAGTLSYQWQHSMDDGASWSVIAGVTGSLYVTPFLSAPRMYRVTVGSSACGSVTTTPVTVQVLPDPSLSITASSPTVCIGGWTTLNAVPNNGAGTCTTQWQSSSSASGPWTNIAGATGNSYSASTLVQGIRYYRATYSCSGGGCDMAFSNVVSITVMPDPSISTQPIGATICSGGTHTLNVTATGGTPALSYQWQSSPDGTSWSNIAGAAGTSYTTPALIATMQYRAMVSASGSGCGTVYSQAALVQVVALPSWSIAPAQAVLCPDTSLMLSVPDAQGVSFLWPDGSTAPQWEVQQPGAYSVVLTHNTYGCSDTLSVNVSAAPAWAQSIEASSDFLCDEVQEIKLTLNGTSGGSYSYAWSGGSLTEQQILTASGVYYLTLTDDVTGCSTVLSRVIQNSDTDITLRIEAPDTLLCRDSEMTLRAVLDGLHESLRERVSYYWRHDGSTNETVSIYGPRLYEITTDFGGGCIQNAEWEILQAPDLEVRIQSPEGTKYACPESPLLLRAVVSDSTLVAAYHWTGGADTPEAVFTESGPYTLRVNDVNGCVWEDRFEVQPCPTIVFFDTLRVQVKAEETAELCLRLINPSQETATTVEVAIEGSPAPYFGEAEALRSVEFAPGETRQCLSYLPPRVEEADSITLYTLRLQNAAGGNEVAIGEARQAELLIEAGIRCRVQQDSAAVNCAVTDTTSIHNGVPLISTLKKDDSFWAGDFEVKVTQSNGNGTFNGKGIITVPYLKQAQINVILKEVRVNEECQMVAGEVKVEGVGAAILSEELANALNDLLGTLDSIDNVLGAVEDVFNTISTVINASSEVNSVLSTNWNVLHGADPIYNEYPDLPDSLRQQINEALLCYLSQPPSVCNAQLSQTISGLIAAINALFEADYAIRFRDFSQQHYGFDSLMYQPMMDDYNFLTVANQPYRVAWKSVEAGRTDSVLLQTPFAQLPDSLHFETNSRTPVPHHEHACGAGCADNGAAILPVTGGEHNKTYQIYPVQTRRDSLGNPERKYAGKLNVVSYNKKQVDVVIVPVNIAKAPSPGDVTYIQEQLNLIYKSAVAEFTCEVMAPISVPSFGDNQLDSTGFRFYSSYNAETYQIISEFKRTNNVNPNKYYIFLVKNAQGNIDGYMPKGKAFGFVVSNDSTSVSYLARTIAHELGHGAFLLNHVFDEFKELNPGETDNIMDYGAGMRLHKYQWDIIHNPQLHISVFDKPEENRHVAFSASELSDFINQDGTFTFLTPAGKPISIVANQLKKLYFYTGENIALNENKFNVALFGSLYQFSIENDGAEITYTSCFNVINNNFAGYYQANLITPEQGCGGSAYVDAKTVPYKVTGQDRDLIVIGFPFFRGEDLVFDIGQIPLDYDPTKVIVEDVILISAPNAIVYKGNGALKPFDTFIPQSNTAVSDDYLFFPPVMKNDKYKTIKISETDITTLGKLFLKHWNDMFESTGSPPVSMSVAAPYIFIHAQQISHYPGFFSNCELDATTFADINETFKDWEGLYNYYQETTQESPQSIRAIVDRIYSGDWIQAWVYADASIYKKYWLKYNPTAVTTFFNNLPTTPNIESRERLLNYLLPWKSNPCAFLPLNGEQRIKILQHFGTTPGDFYQQNWLSPNVGMYAYSYTPPDYDYNNNREFLINLILQTTTKTVDKKSILEYCFGFDYSNPSKYFELEVAMNDALIPQWYSDAKGYAEFVGILSQWIIEDKYSGNLPPISVSPRTSNAPYSSSYPNASFLLNDIAITRQVHFIGSYPHTLSDGATVRDFDGTITLNNNQLLNIATGFNILSGYGEFMSNDAVSSTTSTAPGDLVVIQFVSDYNFPLPGHPNGVKKGDYAIVPAIYAAMLVRKMNNANFERNLRTTGNVLALGLSAATLGASTGFWLVAGAVDIGIILVDETVFNPALYEFEVTGASGISPEAQQRWVNVMLATAGVQVVTGLGEWVITKIRNGRVTKNANLEQHAEVVKHYRLNETHPQAQAHIAADIQEFKKALTLVPQTSQEAARQLIARIKALQLEEVTQYHNSTHALNVNFKVTATQTAQELAEVRIHRNISSSPAGFTTEPFAHQLAQPNEAPFLHIFDDAVLTSPPAQAELVAEMRGIKVRKGSGDPAANTGIAEKASVYIVQNNGRQFVKIVIRAQDFRPLSNSPLDEWYAFLVDKNMIGTVWNSHFAASNALFGQFIQNYAQQSVVLRGIMRNWDEARIDAFMRLDVNDVRDFYFADLANRANAWGKLFDNGAETIENALVTRYIAETNRNAQVVGYVSGTALGRKTFKAINRLTLLAPPSTKPVVIIENMQDLLLSGKLSAEIDNGVVVIKARPDNGAWDEVARLSPDMSDATPVSNFQPADIRQTIYDPATGYSMALVCSGPRCSWVEGACFTAGTPVHTPEGLVPIEKISIGDTVLAYNESSKTPTLAPVTNVFHKTWRGLLRIIAGRDTLLATPNHLFYLPGSGRYMPADSLRRGMQLLALTGALLTVHSVAAVDTTVSVYNFEVAEHHNYYVGNEGVLVHNDCIFQKAGLINMPEQASFNILEQALSGDPNSVAWRIKRDALRSDLGLSPNRDALMAFFRGDDLLAANPGMSSADLFSKKVVRVRAWERLHTLLPDNLKHFATDLEHLNFLTHPDVQNALIWLRDPENGMLTLFEDYPDLLPGEVIALNYYTHRGDQINNYFRSGLSSVASHYLFTHEHVEVYKRFLDGALDKLPPYNIPENLYIWRGTDPFEGNLLKSLIEGDEYDPPFYYSSSLDLETAFIFMQRKRGDVIVGIENGPIRGVNIAPFSHYDELEILFKIYTKFEKIMETPPIPGIVDYTEIIIRTKL